MESVMQLVFGCVAVVGVAGLVFFAGALYGGRVAFRCLEEAQRKARGEAQ